jgi:hypothetical protein
MKHLLNYPQIFSLLRFAMTTAGTAFGVPALASGDVQTAIIGGIAAGLSVVWGFRDASTNVIEKRAEILKK